ncbi:MAG: DNA polymerase [Patescibacteria group bacterium]
MPDIDRKIEIAKWLVDPDKRQILPDDLILLEARLSDLGLNKIYKEIELPLIEILEKMHKIGIKVDVTLLGKLSKKFLKETSSLEKQIYKKSGFPPAGGFNLNSPKQLSEILFEKLKISKEGVSKTKTGNYSTDVGSLLTIQGRHPIINLILKYRKIFKIQSTYIEPLRKLADKNQRVHTTFVQTGTATGRLSSQNPNLQNIPPSVRPVFIAEKGYKLVSFDYSQIELRVLASVANDKKMIEAFQKDLDIHKLTASQVFNTDIHEVTKEQRGFAKTLNFGVIYGMGPVAFARSSGLSIEEAKKFIQEYFSDFANIKIWQEKTINQARKQGYVENLNGRKRWLPQINSMNNWVAREAERVAINMPIQGLAADIIKLAMIKVAKNNSLAGGARMLLSIHDELVFEIDMKVLKNKVSEIKKIMESAYNLKVPLKVDVTMGYA